MANKVQAGLEVVQANIALTSDLLNGYDVLRPLFEHQQTTVDVLQSLALLQPARSNRALWFVLVADQRTYFAQPPAATNRPAITVTETELTVRSRDTTNASPARPGLIAELCIPEDEDAARSTLSQVVNSLKKAPVFVRVDELSKDLRRSLADPKVLVPERHFALALDFTNTEFHAGSSAKRFRLPPPGRLPTNLAPNP